MELQCHVFIKLFSLASPAKYRLGGSKAVTRGSKILSFTWHFSPLIFELETDMSNNFQVSLRIISVNLLLSIDIII